MTITMLRYFLIGIVVFCIDRVTKYMALVWLGDQVVSLNNYLSCELVINRGISWGMFHSQYNFLFVVVSLIIALITGMVCWHAYYFLQRGLSITSHVFVIAGSLSNLVDRVFYAGVVDFIVLSYRSYSWPVFNCADVAIIVGLLLFIVHNDNHV